MRAQRLALAGLMIVTVAAVRSLTAQRADAGAIQQIRDEASRRSQLAATVGTLTDIYGPRLTGSPNLKAAADFVIDKLKGWGIADARPELWGPFGPGWSNDRFSALAVSPQSFPLIAYPKAWTPGTTGDVRAEAVEARVDRESDFDTYRGTLRDKFVLTTASRPVGEIAADSEDALRFARRRMEFFASEGVVALLEPATGRDGAVVAGDGRVASSFAAGMYPWPETVPAQVVVAAEHYSWIARTIGLGVPVVLEMSIANTYFTAEPNSFNVIAEIRGAGAPDEVVMIGAHLDSSHIGSGALDNAAGCAVVLEALRVLKATRLKMRRTVRLVLWTGSVQGQLGSRAYVHEHYANSTNHQPRPGYATLSAYFNVDDGTGPFSGIYVEGNRAVAPIFEQWVLPFGSVGMSKVSLESRPGKDHLAFVAAGLNGFHFMQEGADRDDRLRQSNFDLYNLLQPDALMQNAAIVAAFAYEAANREDALPRGSASR